MHHGWSSAGGGGKSKGGKAGGKAGDKAGGKPDKPKLLLANKYTGAQDISGWLMSEKLDGIRTRKRREKKRLEERLEER